MRTLTSEAFWKEGRTIRKRVKFSVTLPAELVEEIDRQAKEGYRDRTRQIELMIQGYLGRIQAQDEASERGQTE